MKLENVIVERVADGFVKKHASDIDDAAEAMFENSTPPPDGTSWRGEGRPLRLSTDFGEEMELLRKKEEDVAGRPGRIRVNATLRLKSGVVVDSTGGILVTRFVKFYGAPGKKAVEKAFRKAVGTQSNKLGRGIRDWFDDMGYRALPYILDGGYREAEDYDVLNVDFLKGVFVRRDIGWKFNGPVMAAEVSVSYLLQKKPDALSPYSDMSDAELKQFVEAYAGMAPENFWMDGEYTGTYAQRVKDLMRQWRSMSPRQQERHYQDLRSWVR